MVLKKQTQFISILLALCLLSGCSSTKFLSKDFQPEQIERIVVLPFMDARENPNPKYDFAEITGVAGNSLLRSLKYFKKYRAVFSEDIGTVSSYSTQDLPAPDPNAKNPKQIDPNSVNREWVKQLGPTGSKWILVPVLEKLSYYNALIQLGTSAKVSLYLFNKETGELWAYDTATGQFSAGILAAGMLKLSISGKHDFEIIAIDMAVSQCLRHLPLHPKPYELPG